MESSSTIPFPGVNRRAPAVRAKIEATALELSRFISSREVCDLNPGTLLAKLHANGKFKDSHLHAARRVIADLELGRHAVARVNGSAATPADDAYDRLRLLIDEQLTSEERQLFVNVFAENYFSGGAKGSTLADIGRSLSGYQGQQQATSAAVRSVQALLERIGAYYADL